MKRALEININPYARALWVRTSGELPEPTSGKIYEMFKKNVESNEGRLVDVTMMQNYFKRLENSEVMWHQTRSHVSRGRVNYYYLSEDYSIEDFYKALEENGVKPWMVPSAKDYFK